MLFLYCVSELLAYFLNTAAKCEGEEKFSMSEICAKVYLFSRISFFASLILSCVKYFKIGSPVLSLKRVHKNVLP